MKSFAAAAIEPRHLHVGRLDEPLAGLDDPGGLTLQLECKGTTQYVDRHGETVRMKDGSITGFEIRFHDSNLLFGASGHASDQLLQYELRLRDAGHLRTQHLRRGQNEKDLG